MSAEAGSGKGPALAWGACVPCPALPVWPTPWQSQEQLAAGLWSFRMTGPGPRTLGQLGSLQPCGWARPPSPQEVKDPSSAELQCSAVKAAHEPQNQVWAASGSPTLHTPALGAPRAPALTNRTGRGRPGRAGPCDTNPCTPEKKKPFLGTSGMRMKEWWPVYLLSPAGGLGSVASAGTTPTL